MDREKRIEQIENRLRNRRLVFFGTRGADAESLLAIDQFEHVFSQIAPLKALSVDETSLEELTGERVDLDTYDIDRDERDVIRQFRKSLLRTFEAPAAVIPYRSCAVLSSAWFPRSDRVLYMGIFHEKQACFEHKAWVETELRRQGVSTIPWKYYADDQLDLIREFVEAGPAVLRVNRTDGGAGVSLVRNANDIQSHWPAHADGFLAVAPFLSPSIPLNVNACVFPNGEIALHPASLQLIGISTCTTRPFGYCGNDFARFADLDLALVNDLQEMTVTVGKWLWQNGYLGAFGIDALLYKGTVYLTEINPRFQGSSVISASIDRELERPDVYMDHIAAFLGLPAPGPITLREIAARQPAVAHVICHNGQDRPVTATRTSPDSLPVRTRLLAAPGTKILHDAILLQAVFAGPVTDDGMSLSRDTGERLNELETAVFGMPQRVTHTTEGA